MRMKTLVSAALAASLLLSGGCVYRIDISQGNYIEQKQIDRLRAGMTREQVQYVLGTPMLRDSFDPDTWLYVYYFKSGWQNAEQKELKVHFQQDRLVKLSGDFPEPKEFHHSL